MAPSRRKFPAALAVYALLSLVQARAQSVEPLVFVSRQIPAHGSVFWDVPNDMPGAGPYSRFRVAAPGRLLVRESNGGLRTLVDGAAPSAASLFLIDVSAPDVSYDGTSIVFAGLTAGSYDLAPANHPNAWRLYSIRADGTSLRQITFTPPALDLAQFGAAAAGLAGGDDTDPVFLPDGRIVFASTRWPAFGQYNDARTTNLFVVDASGTNLHRITSERSGAERPRVDPLTGRVVYTRWWRNHRFPINSMQTVAHGPNGFDQKDGLSALRDVQVGGPDYLWRNAWHAASVRPDGTELALFAGSLHSDLRNFAYGGDFAPDGSYVANFFPMMVMTKASGFGGLRRFERGAHHYDPVAGITTVSTDFVNPTNPTSYGIYNGEYVSEPCVLQDGSIVASRAFDVAQDYGLWRLANGTWSALVDLPGTTELRARRLAPRALAPILADHVTHVASALPPLASGPFDTNGTFVFECLNVYANAPVDTEIISAPAVGTAAKLRFFLDHQRTSPGSYPWLDWPILLAEKRVSPAGRVFHPALPADVPLFEQLRNSRGNVPFTGGVDRDGAGHVAGLNFGRQGAVARCVGCHAGHTLMEVPGSLAAAAFTNLAPGARVRVSSTRDATHDVRVIDRRVAKGNPEANWTSAPGVTQSQWVELTFLVPVTVRTVRLYNLRPGGAMQSSVQVHGARVRLYADPQATALVASASCGALAPTGTDVAFGDVRARAIKVELGAASGTWNGLTVTGLGEIEVIARGEEP
ncbi:MAG: TolB family protein [Planctomycetota bacterium]